MATDVRTSKLNVFVVLRDGSTISGLMDTNLLLCEPWKQLDLELRRKVVSGKRPTTSIPRYKIDRVVVLGMTK